MPVYSNNTASPADAGQAVADLATRQGRQNGAAAAGQRAGTTSAPNTGRPVPAQSWPFRGRGGPNGTKR